MNYLAFGIPQGDLDGDRFFLTDQIDLDELASPYPPWPEQGALIGWGATGSGDGLYWRTGPDPEKWSTVVWRRQKAPTWAEFDLGAVDLIHGWLTGRIRPLSGVVSSRTPPRFVHWKVERDMYLRREDLWA